MVTFKVAQIRQWGVDLIIIPLDPSFNYKTPSEKNSDVMAFQIAANKDGLQGTVIPVWMKERDVRFVAPTDWYPLLRNLTWSDVLCNINRELTISS